MGEYTLIFNNVTNYSLMSIKIWVKNRVKWVRKGLREMLEASRLGQPCLLRQPCWLASDPPLTTLLVGQAVRNRKQQLAARYLYLLSIQ
jgi:hypothetical protein